MDGVAVIISLLTGSGINSLVPDARIMAGVLPQGTVLPAISVTSVSQVDRHAIKKGSVTHTKERVQVTVLAATYEDQKAVQRAVISACDAMFPTISGISAVTVHTESGGPDFMNEEASVFIGTQDFTVTYSAER